MDKSFEDLVEDPDIVNIMNKVSCNFQRGLDFDEIQSIKLDTLWKCVKNYDTSKGAKFTTYLHNQLNFYDLWYLFLHFHMDCLHIQVHVS